MKTQSKSTRFTASQIAEVEDAAKVKGLTASTFIRMAALASAKKINRKGKR